MTLRELTKRQTYNLTRKMNKRKKEFMKSYVTLTPENGFLYGYDKGVKDTLALFTKP